MKYIEGITVICIYMLYIVGPLALFGVLEEVIVRTKVGRQFEAWLYKKLGIGPEDK